MQDAVRAKRDIGFQMSGNVEDRLEATWHGSLKDPQVFSEPKIAGSITSAPTANQASPSVPFDATAQVKYDGRNHSAFHRRPEGGIQSNGVIAFHLSIECSDNLNLSPRLNHID